MRDTTDYLDLARRAPTSTLRRRYLSEHKAQKLRASISGCRECPLGRLRRHAVPWDGPINGKAKLVLVGEAPGANEDREAVPFVGRAGKTLNKCLEAAGVSRDEVAILNTLCCRPPSNRDPEPDEMAACGPNFQDQLDLIGVSFGVALGGYASAAVLGEDRGTIRMKDIRGKVAWRHNMIWTFTYHPAYILRNGNMAGLFAGDLRLAIDTATGLLDFDLPFKDLTPGDLDPHLGEGIHDHIRRKGWVTINLRKLGVTVIVVPNEKAKYQLPNRAGNHPIYTLTELMHLGFISRQHQLPTATLRNIHEAKVSLGGMLIA